MFIGLSLLAMLTVASAAIGQSQTQEIRIDQGQTVAQNTPTTTPATTPGTPGAPGTPVVTPGAPGSPPTVTPADSTKPVQPLSPPAVLPSAISPVGPLSPRTVVIRSAIPDEVQRGDTVVNRPRPDYDPFGVRWDSFIVRPDLGLEESYSDNIFATTKHKTSDFITTINPQLDIKSDWNNHALNFHADATIGLYAKNSAEDYQDYTFAADGRIDVMHDLRLFANLAYAQRHEPRGSPNDIGAREPQQYSVTTAKLGVEKVFNRLGFRLDGTFDAARFDPVKFAGGLGTVSQSGRDNDRTEIALRTSYEIGPLRQVYVLTSYNWRNYTHTLDISGFDRDSKGFLLGVGATYDLTGVMFVDILIGYRWQDYEDRRLSTIHGVSGKAQLIWNVTRLTTFTATASREIQETILPNSAGYFESKAQLSADHELLRNLLLNANIGYERDTFEGINRTDNYYTGGFSAKYLINRNFTLSGGYRFRHRTGDSGFSNTFDENVFFVRLNSHL